MDEADRLKQGEKSVGVLPQYVRTVGKQPHRPVRVEVVASDGEIAAPVAERFHSPGSWAGDPALTLGGRCAPEVKFNPCR